jgi:hypothetical protein
MRTAMPSPLGTNHARLFLNPRGAYDAMPADGGAELVEFLRGKLSDADLAEFCKMAGIDASMSMDEPIPFKGLPQPGGGKFGEDSRRRPHSAAESASFAQRFPHAAKIKVSV